MIPSGDTLDRVREFYRELNYQGLEYSAFGLPSEITTIDQFMVYQELIQRINSEHKLVP